MAPTPEEARAAFMRTFKETAPHQHRYEVWRDFVTMAACALHNGLAKEDSRETEYLETIRRYGKADQHRFPQLLSQLVAALDAEPTDVLGSLYMELEIGSKDRGQFFTPAPLSEVMSAMVIGENLIDQIKAERFVTIHEPACGAGGMILAAVKTIIEAGHDPAHSVFASCVDVDRVAALMCYIQLSLWNVPAEVVVGNTLSLEVREVWYTPAYRLFNWEHRLQRRSEASKGDVSPTLPKTMPKCQEEPKDPPE